MPAVHTVHTTVLRPRTHRKISRSWCQPCTPIVVRWRQPGRRDKQEGESSEAEDESDHGHGRWWLSSWTMGLCG